MMSQFLGFEGVWEEVAAQELLKLPLEERDRILSAQAARAEQIYRNDPELTTFEAFGAEDFFDKYPED